MTNETWDLSNNISIQFVAQNFSEVFVNIWARDEQETPFKIVSNIILNDTSISLPLVTDLIDGVYRIYIVSRCGEPIEYYGGLTLGYVNVINGGECYLNTYHFL